MIALPMPIIWKIPRAQKQKIGILLAFLVAGLGTLASCIRVYSIKIFTQSPQPIRDTAPISTWSFIEINLGIICASVAVIKPLFSKTRAPSLRKIPAGRLGSIAIVPTAHKKSLSFPAVFKDVFDWSASHGSASMATPSSIAPDTLPERDLESGLDGREERYSKPLPELPRVYHRDFPRR